MKRSRKSSSFKWHWIMVSGLVLTGLAGCSSDSDDDDGSSSPTPSSTASPEPTGSPEPTSQVSPEPTLEPSPSPTPTPTVDADGDGSSAAADCDDQEANTYPGAVERCDEQDNDCDEQVDEGLEQVSYYPDADGDGFGTETAAGVSCAPPAGYAAARGDCDDDAPAIYAGATDADGDGIDQDCGGSDGPQPSVGLSGSTAASIQAALEQAMPGDTVWVGPGTYKERDLSFGGKAVTLISTHFAGATVVDAQSSGRGFVFNAGETATTVLDGFTVTKGSSKGAVEGDRGGAVYINSASPVLRNCVISNSTAGLGGGVYVLKGTLTLENCALTGNNAPGGDGQGGGIYLDTASANISGSRFTSNSADDGGGVFLYKSSANVVSSAFADNAADPQGGGYGGGINVDTGSGLTVERTTFSSNSAGEAGGGIYGNEAKPLNVSKSTFVENDAPYGGGVSVGITQPKISSSIFLRNGRGGCYLTHSGGQISNSYFKENDHGCILRYSSTEILNSVFYKNYTSADDGGAISSSSSSIRISNCVIVGNSAPNCGGISFYSTGEYPEVMNSVVAYNDKFNMCEKNAVTAEVTYSSVYSTNPLTNVDGVLLDASNIVAEPEFLSYDDEDLLAEFHLALTSVLINAGNPKDTDPDGTRADIGAFGGKLADDWDLDSDGVPSWFWPGTILDAPAGFEPSSYDCDDSDAAIQSCP